MHKKTDERLREFCLAQSVKLIQRLPDSFGTHNIYPMQLAELLFKYIKSGEVNDLEGLAF
ncbi:MAG: hypothetical protein ACRC9P_08285 [Bacteroides sp.]